ncbi:glycosyl hydrolases family 31-domain-containing protein [Geopyxis carbonaria]|nr:glycosyl hydrolases family 31-domain-containing protein [Geopyxis carbonaria]
MAVMPLRDAGAGMFRLLSVSEVWTGWTRGGGCRGSVMPLSLRHQGSMHTELWCGLPGADTLERSNGSDGSDGLRDAVPCVVAVCQDSSTQAQAIVSAKSDLQLELELELFVTLLTRRRRNPRDSPTRAIPLPPPASPPPTPPPPRPVKPRDLHCDDDASVIATLEQLFDCNDATVNGNGLGNGAPLPPSPPVSEKEENVKGNEKEHAPPSMDTSNTATTLTPPSPPSPAIGLGGYTVTAQPTPTTSILTALPSQPTHYGPPFHTLHFTATHHATSTIRLHLCPDTPRWRIPASIVPLAPAARAPAAASPTVITAPLGQPFTFKLPPLALALDPSTPLVATDLYTSFALTLPPRCSVYGMGEVTGSFKRKPGSRYAFWARDAQCPVGENAYSSLPFFICVSPAAARRCVGVYLHSSNALDLHYAADGTRMTFHIVGGDVELFVFAGPSYAAVAAQFQALVGRPRLPPYWAFGYHQSRWGYDTTAKLEASMERHRQAGVPVDAFWLDIDYMDAYRLFTLDESRYPGFAAWVRETAKGRYGKRLVAVIDPGIKTVPAGDASYPPYTTGASQGLFLRRPDGTDFTAKVWPGHVALPDWFHPATSPWWTSHLAAWLRAAPVDGLWLDMNEAANFINGDAFAPAASAADRVDEIFIPTDPESVVHSGDAAQRGAEKPPPPAAFDSTRPLGVTNPPYSIAHGGVAAQWPLHARSTAVDAVHAGGATEFDAHNLFGLQSCVATSQALLQLRPQERPFVLTRSTFASGGRHASKWLGDNWSTWESMRHSVAGVLAFQMYGTPHVGADIGGFNGVPTTELLTRWVQVGAWYPFARNHNLPTTPCQEVWRQDVVGVARTALRRRYGLLPFWYTVFRELEVSGGVAVAPVWADDAGSIEAEGQAGEGVDESFLVGSHILVAPALYEGQRSVRTWLPPGLWFPLYPSPRSSVPPLVGGAWATLDAPLDTCPALVRAGCIIPLHPDCDTQDSTGWRAAGYSLLIVLDAGDAADGAGTGTAKGTLYLDDGISMHSRSRDATLWEDAGAVEADSSDVTFEAVAVEGGVRLTVGGRFGYTGAEAVVRGVEVVDVDSEGRGRRRKSGVVGIGLGGVWEGVVAVTEEGVA